MCADVCPGGVEGGPTPAELRELQARAAALAQEIAELRERLRRQPDLPRGVRGSLLGGADDAVEQAARRIGDAAEGLARVRASQWRGACTARWGICRDCGLALHAEDGRSWCRQCGARWDYDRSQVPCGDRGVFLAMDEMGGTVVVCAAHGRYLQERLDGGVLLAIPTS